MTSNGFSVGQCVTAACLLEAAAPKPGNVHRSADFEDMTFYDMCVSAIAIGPAIESAPTDGVGSSVHAAVASTHAAVSKNTNLGTILLLAPLAASGPDLEDTGEVLAALDAADARDIYAAIRLAKPGGLGSTSQHDISGDAPADVIIAMQLAADRDLVARQYANGFLDLKEFVLPRLNESLEAGHELPNAIIHLQMQIMREFPDSLIARKRGSAVAKRSSELAAEVLAAGQPGERSYLEALADFDFWLRSDGHARNPGTTADMIAAALFVALRRGDLDLSATRNISITQSID